MTNSYQYWKKICTDVPSSMLSGNAKWTIILLGVQSFNMLEYNLQQQWEIIDEYVYIYTIYANVYLYVDVYLWRYVMMRWWAVNLYLYLVGFGVRDI